MILAIDIWGFITFQTLKFGGKVHIVGWPQWISHFAPNCADLSLNPWFHNETRWRQMWHICNQSLCSHWWDRSWYLKEQGRKIWCSLLENSINFTFTDWLMYFSFLHSWEDHFVLPSFLCISGSLSHVYSWLFWDQVIKNLGNWWKIETLLFFFFYHVSSEHKHYSNLTKLSVYLITYTSVFNIKTPI